MNKKIQNGAKKKEDLMSNPHKWSGWPGAFCLKCGSEDPTENAIGLGWLDPGGPCEDGSFSLYKWDTEEHRLIVEKANICPNTNSGGE